MTRLRRPTSRGLKAVLTAMLLLAAAGFVHSETSVSPFILLYSSNTWTRGQTVQNKVAISTIIAVGGSTLTVGGIVESLFGGFKFPDGTTQMSAAVSYVLSTGTAVSGASANRTLFLDSGTKTATSSNYTYNDTTKILSVPNVVVTTVTFGDGTTMTTKAVVLSTGIVVNGSSANLVLYADSSTKTATLAGFGFNGSTMTAPAVSASTFSGTYYAGSGSGDGAFFSASTNTQVGVNSSTIVLNISTNGITMNGSSLNAASGLVQLNGSSQLPAVSGVNLTNLNATNLASGSVADARLSANVPLLNAANTFSVTGNIFTGTTTFPVTSVSTGTVTRLKATTAGIGPGATASSYSSGGGNTILEIDDTSSVAADTNDVMVRMACTDADLRCDMHLINDSSDIMAFMNGGSSYTDTTYGGVSGARWGSIVYQDSGAGGSGFRIVNFGSKPFAILTNNAERVRVLGTGEVGIGTKTPGTLLHVSSGVVTIGGSGAGLILGQGNTTWTAFMSGSNTLDFGATAGGACDVLNSTITVTGAVDGNIVSLGIPSTLATSDTAAHFWAYVSASSQIAVVRCCDLLVGNCSNPAAAVVKVRVDQ